MALKAVHISDVPNLDRVPENPSLGLCSPRSSQGRASPRASNKFLVIGHRGNGMNRLESSDRRLMSFRENTILSFNAAKKLGADFVEFDVQVTKDDCPVIFHDIFVLSQENGSVSEKRVTELSLSEFLSYGPQREPNKAGRSVLRKTRDGKILEWEVETDDALCTLREAFQRVDPSLGFNIELKFDDNRAYGEDHLAGIIKTVLRVVGEFADGRRIIFSSFHPDAAALVGKLQSSYPVLFLTNGGNEVYGDARRNSLEAGMKVCQEGGLQGMVSEARAVLRNPGAVGGIKDARLSLLTYGQLNNVGEAVQMQQVMGVEGVIVDLVEEANRAVQARPHFSEAELAFMLKLIPTLVQPQ